MKKLLLLTLGILASLQISYGAIAFDNKAAATGSVTSSVTFSHTTSGSNRILFVAVTAANGDTTGVTYSGVAMTKINNTVVDNGVLYTSLWYLIAPATGANNVIVSTAGTAVVGSSASYTGASQTGQPDASTTTGSATTASFASSVTSINDNSWTIATSRTGNGFTLTGGANTVVRNQPELVQFGAGGLWDSGINITPAGASTLTVTCTSQFFGGAIMASFKPAVSVSTPTYFGAVKFMRHR